MNAIKLGLLLYLLLLVSACSIFSEADDFKGIGINERDVESGSHVNAYLWGYYLFGEFPIVTGDPDCPGSCVWFQDTVSKAEAVRFLTQEAEKRGCDVTSNISTVFSSTGAFSYWILYYKDSQASGNIIKTNME